MLVSILQFAAADGTSNFDLTQFGAFGVTLAFGWWVLRDTQKERDKARGLADQQSRTLDSMERVLTSVQGTLEGFETALNSLSESIRNIPPEVELKNLRETLERLEGIIGVQKG